MVSSVPTYRLGVHVRRLCNAGYKVGVVRQAETAALKAAGLTAGGKSGTFDRKLTGVFTSTTMIEDDLIGSTSGSGDGSGGGSSTSGGKGGGFRTKGGFWVSTGGKKSGGGDRDCGEAEGEGGEGGFEGEGEGEAEDADGGYEQVWF